MASAGSDLPDPASFASFLQLLFGSRNGENSPSFPPLLLSVRNPRNSSNPDQNSTNPDAENVRERLVMINPFTQTMLVIDSSSSSRGGGDSNEESAFESWMNDFFFRKEGQPPASKASMEAMPEVEIGGKGVECVICLEEFGIGEKGKEMPCKHSFHGGCIEKWLKIHGTCPVCRFKMPVEEKVSSDDDKQDQENQIGGGEGGRRSAEVWMGFAFGGNNQSSSTDEESSAAAAATTASDDNMNDID